MELLTITLGLFFAFIVYTIYTSNKPKQKPKTLADYGVHISEPQSQTTIRNKPNANYFAWPVLMEFDFEVVGESNYQDAIRKIAEQQETEHANIDKSDEKTLIAYLIPDDNNPYDNKAVRIDINGMQVGHLSREDARSFRRRLSAKKLVGQITTCGAKIIGGHIKDGKQMSYGVILDIKPF